MELLFAAKQDLEAAIAVPAQVELEHVALSAPMAAKDVEKARDEAVIRIGKKLNCTFVKRGRALRVSSDGSNRLVCLASQRYEGPGKSGNYWFGFTPAQQGFLSGRASGWLALVCADSGRTILVEWIQFKTWLVDLWTTPKAPATASDIRHWHLYFNDYGSRIELMKSGGGILLDLAPFLIQAP